MPEGSDFLDLAADANASAAEDALFGIADDRRARQVLLVALAVTGEDPVADAHGLRQPLQFAVAVTFARVAVHRVVVHQQLDEPWIESLG